MVYVLFFSAYLLLMYRCSIYMNLVIWTRTVYPNSPGVEWPSPWTAWIICCYLMGLCRKIERGTWVTALPPSPLHGVGTLSLLLLSEDCREEGREKEGERKLKHFSSLARVSVELMESGLPALNKASVECLQKHCFSFPGLMLNKSVTSITKLLTGPSNMAKEVRSFPPRLQKGAGKNLF